MKAWNKCLAATLNIVPFDEKVQREAVVECVRGQLTAFDYTHEKNEEEEYQEWDDEDSEDESKDELDLMKQITIGSRRSSRKRKEAKRKGYCIDSSFIQLDSDQEDIE